MIDIVERIFWGIILLVGNYICILSTLSGLYIHTNKEELVYGSIYCFILFVKYFFMLCVSFILGIRKGEYFSNTRLFRFVEKLVC